MKSDPAMKNPRPYTQQARARAAEETGERIIDAFLSLLMEKWFDDITLDRVAADANVTVQTVVRRFGSKEGLLKSAVKTFADRITASRATASGNIDQMIDNLASDYEVTGDAVIRLLALEPRYEAIKEVLAIGRHEHRAWVSETLALHLGSLGKDKREKAIDELVIATDVYTWKLLRRDMARSQYDSAQSMKHLVLAVISNLDSV
jgi:AcrR family transcriptional regulator